MAHFSIKLASLLILLSIISACKPTENLFKKTVFTFELEQQQYQIIGYTDKRGLQEGTNDLISRTEDKITFWYRDANQNGQLDSRLRGSLTIDEANLVYRIGIQLAMDDGRFKEQPYARRYQKTIGHIDYEIISFSVDSPLSYNLFIVFNRTTGQLIRLRDSDRNGLLDDPDLSEEILKIYQPDYETILDFGIEAGLILYDGQRYLVRQKQV